MGSDGWASGISREECASSVANDEDVSEDEKRHKRSSKSATQPRLDDGTTAIPEAGVGRRFVIHSSTCLLGFICFTTKESITYVGDGKIYGCADGPIIARTRIVFPVGERILVSPNQGLVSD
jgi:hypothetical protein